MTDAFALLDEPRQPWLEVEALKTKFLTRSAATHPDKFTDPAEKETAQTRFADLNSAHEILRDPKLRLQHLLHHHHLFHHLHHLRLPYKKLYLNLLYYLH